MNSKRGSRRNWNRTRRESKAVGNHTDWRWFARLSIRGVAGRRCRHLPHCIAGISPTNWNCDVAQLCGTSTASTWHRRRRRVRRPPTRINKCRPWIADAPSRFWRKPSRFAASYGCWAAGPMPLRKHRHLRLSRRRRPQLRKRKLRPANCRPSRRPNTKTRLTARLFPVIQLLATPNSAAEFLAIPTSNSSVRTKCRRIPIGRRNYFPRD